MSTVDYTALHTRDNGHYDQCICDICTADNVKIGFTSCTCAQCDPSHNGINAFMASFQWRNVEDILGEPLEEKLEEKPPEIPIGELVLKSVETKTHIIQIWQDDGYFSVKILYRDISGYSETICVRDLKEAEEEFARLLRE